MSSQQRNAKRKHASASAAPSVKDSSGGDRAESKAPRKAIDAVTKSPRPAARPQSSARGGSAPSRRAREAPVKKAAPADPMVYTKTDPDSTNAESKTKQQVDELDDLFAGLKKKQKQAPSASNESKLQPSSDSSSKPEPAKSKTKPPKSNPSNAKAAPASRPAAPPSDDMGFTRGSKSSSKQTEEGFRVYSVDELNIGQGGDTENCPFDCECCY